ncbi:MAG: trypsin-like peptidase domain-containing protein, partial [Thermodesulfobacteriota bacterium]
MRTLRLFALRPGLTFCWFLLYSVAVPGWAQAQNPLDVMFDRVSRSLVKVECLDTGNSASGFVWSGRETVVTALHVVDRSSDIQLYFPGAKVRRRAVVDKVLKEADLTLLRVENAPDLPVLLPAGQRPETNEG